MKEADLLVETKKARMDNDPTPGDELESLIKKVMDQPKEVTERVKKCSPTSVAAQKFAE